MSAMDERVVAERERSERCVDVNTTISRRRNTVLCAARRARRVADNFAKNDTSGPSSEATRRDLGRRVRGRQTTTRARERTRRESRGRFARGKEGEARRHAARGGRRRGRARGDAPRFRDRVRVRLVRGAMRGQRRAERAVVHVRGVSRERGGVSSGLPGEVLEDDQAREVRARDRRPGRDAASASAPSRVSSSSLAIRVTHRPARADLARRPRRAFPTLRPPPTPRARSQESQDRVQMPARVQQSQRVRQAVPGQGARRRRRPALGRTDRNPERSGRGLRLRFSSSRRPPVRSSFRSLVVYRSATLRRCLNRTRYTRATRRRKNDARRRLPRWRRPRRCRDTARRRKRRAKRRRRENGKRKRRPRRARARRS